MSLRFSDTEGQHNKKEKGQLSPTEVDETQRSVGTEVGGGGVSSSVQQHA